jgi:hypothetical protein
VANVTVVLMDGSGGNNCGVFEISGGGNINMSAQTSGTYSGILFFRHASCGSTAGDMKLVGGATATVVGAIYSPTKEVKVSSGTTLSGSCLQIVADTIELSGSGTIGNDCDGAGYPNRSRKQGLPGRISRQGWRPPQRHLTPVKAAFAAAPYFLTLAETQRGLKMTNEGIVFLAVMIGAAALFMGLLTWAERRTRKQD